ncbi:NAD(P)-binding domain-containing protein, partial [uncultured Microbacterium sp.]|uniref:NAD(P)-binding domain-containing protein n=1 Tax=uncultured Microbacterium sp. TaxID=191216 RepID=UPI002626C23A
MTRIAFLGLGHMGLPMAVNLMRAGHDVRGFDLVPAALEAARQEGITIADSGADAASTADVVITMFPAGRHVIDAYEGGLLAAAPPGTLFIESSTIAVDEA